MRHCQAVVLALVAGALGGGCVGQPQRPAPLFDARRSFGGPDGDDVVQIDVAVLERPAGDRYVNHDLWELADEQGVNLERKPVLEDNGFRVCQIGGLPPAGLQGLLASPRSNPDPRQVRLHAGTPNAVPLGPPRDHCHFELKQEDRALPADLEQAQCLVEVVPALAEDGRILLRFTPHVKHGKPVLGPQPRHDPAGTLRWELETNQPDEAYPWLSWDLTVAPNEYVVVGTRLDRPGTLGHCCFLHAEGRPPVQRLLVIRTARAPGRPALDESLSRSPPLALQAGWNSARGSSQ